VINPNDNGGLCLALGRLYPHNLPPREVPVPGAVVQKALYGLVDLLVVLHLNGPDHVLGVKVHKLDPPIRLPWGALWDPSTPLVARHNLAEGDEAVSARALVKV
jgi:hypothetical protein